MKFAFQRDHSRCGVENGMVGKEFKCENIQEGITNVQARRDGGSDEDGDDEDFLISEPT